MSPSIGSNQDHLAPGDLVRAGRLGIAPLADKCSPLPSGSQSGAEERGGEKDEADCKSAKGHEGFLSVGRPAWAFAGD